MAEVGGYDPQSREEVVESRGKERQIHLQYMCANAPGPGNSKAPELCVQSYNSVPHGWNNGDVGDGSHDWNAAGQG